MMAPVCFAFDAFDASRYQTGEMQREERLRYERHLATCAACRASLRRQRRLDELVGRLPSHAAPPVAEAFLAPLLGAAGPPVAAVSAAMPAAGARRAWRTWRRVTGGLAAAAVLVAVGWWMRALRVEGFVRDAMAADAGLLARSGAPGAGVDVRRLPWLGFSACGADISPQGEGIHLCALDRDGPLGRAGARAGDRLIRVDDEPVPTTAAMYRLLAGHRAGDSVRVVFRGAGGARRGVVPLAARPADLAHIFTMEWSPELREHATRLRPGELSAESIFHIGRPAASDDTAGAVVLRELTAEQWGYVRLLGDSPWPFGEGGLRVGDRVLAVGDRAARDWADFIEGYFELASGPLPVLVERDGGRLILTLGPPDSPVSGGR